MRLLKILFAIVIAVTALAGCGLFEESDKEKFERILDESASFSVFLDDDVTEQQRADIRARLEKEPGVTEVTFETKAAAYEKFKEIWADDPEFVDQVNEDSMPESFRLTTENAATSREIRDGSAADELEAMPGVREVIFPCTTIEECRQSVVDQNSGRTS
ncbi:hypothetical protein GCM10010112_34060 [Actinoplanes lobatus]|uniref:Cell division transport system permease protein n=1 Tax=Actinoplanes lobatus TaxID=113568 RepID=A0A7W7HHP5_9ACTN|nr:permease-like cell division protein FtsX [Actinoplanes lobatus]MBB4750702.1 cell division transport system permease protein [Actinoplanes lobatus]GGN69007.1 hypothetical protein GCM10010112_34060 [Actinoplanes lobatus]GIE42142.1 hypothetical protein Alo02nite_50400 [Actinoplanes lobatus]